MKHVPGYNLNPMKYDLGYNLPIPLKKWDVYTLEKSMYSYHDNCTGRGIVEWTSMDESISGSQKIERQVYFYNRKRHYAAIKIQREYRRRYLK